MPRAILFALPFASLLALSIGCADGRDDCRVGADCPSGVCRADGTCATPRDAGGGDAPIEPSDAPPDVPIEMNDAGDVDAGGRVCSGNHDGVVSRDEVPLRAGLRATFRIAEGAAVSTSGSTSGGVRTWDYTGSYPGDADVLVELQAPGASWWAAEFPTASHAARLAQSSTNLGIFQITDDALLLLGVASPEPGTFTQTLLTYEPPVTVLAFPLENGDTFSTTSTVSGQAAGVVVFYTETYSSVVDAAGMLRTPFGNIDALRVRTEMTRTSGLVTLTSQRQFTFAGECFGIAAVITSGPFETEVEFTTASEIRRLAP